MARLYSKRLLAGGATDSLSATVPPDVVWVVRDSILYFDGVSSSDAYALLGELVGGATVVIQRGQVAGGSEETIEWQGRQVLESGDQLVFGASTANWYVIVSGYELTLP